MARPLRFEFAGATYRAMACQIERRDIVPDVPFRSQLALAGVI
jgi:hypothetical protein